MQRLNKWMLFVGTTSVLLGGGFCGTNLGNSTLAIVAIDAFDLVLGGLIGTAIGGAGLFGAGT
jgi:hypothetical protein